MIIADDFTGALDTGIQFVKSSIKTDVYADCGTMDLKSSDADVLIVNSDSRHSAPEDAYAAVRKIVKAGRDAGVNFFYKKTDSALRGNVGSELQAVMDETGMNYMQFVPALPYMNRTTSGGIHYIDGVPVGESEFSRDKYSPVTKSRVKDILSEQTDAPVHVHSERRAGSGAGIHIYDAETEEDLVAIAGSLKESGAFNLIAGCSGMAAAVPDMLDLKGSIHNEIKLMPGLLVVCGSTNLVTRRQIAYAESSGFMHLNLSPDQTLTPDWVKSIDEEEFARCCISDFAKGGRVIIDSNDALEGATEAYAKEHCLGQEDIRRGISNCLGTILRDMLDEGLKATMLLTGGDTLLAFMKQIGESQLTPIRELSAGVVLSKVNYKGTDYPVISKSGGFGQESLLTELADTTLLI